jgi:hypothetical protein
VGAFTLTDQMKRLSVLVVGTLLAMFGALPAAAVGTTIGVTSNGDSGAGTLRQAIIESNNGNPNSPPGQREPNSIQMVIPVGTPQVIDLVSALQPIIYPVVLNGAGVRVADTFAPPSGDVVALNLGSDGSNINSLTVEGATAGAGLSVFSNNNTISHNTIDLNGDGVQIQGDPVGGAADGNRVQGNFIGTDSAGHAHLGNAVGLVMLSKATGNNTIGGTTPGARNVISGNTADGVVLLDAGTGHNLLEGNFIGTDPTGAAGLGNGGDGVLIMDGAGNDTFAPPGGGAIGNVISGNGGDGVLISGPGTGGNLLQGNYIGTNAAGTSALGNGGDGVLIMDGAGNDTLAPPGGGAIGNVISGNGGDGVLISGPGTSGNLLQGNDIGTDAGGFGGNLLPNAAGGVQFSAGASDNEISGGVVAAGNNHFAIDAGNAANQLLQSSLIGGPAPLIIGGQSMTLNAGTPSQISNGTSYPIVISGAPPTGSVNVNLLRSSCTGNVAKLQFFTVQQFTVNDKGIATGTLTGPPAPAAPAFLPSGSTGVNNLGDPCPATPPVAHLPAG